MYNGKERTKILAWFFLFALELCSLAEASIGNAGERKPSFFGILGNVFCGGRNENENNNCGVSPSSPYTSLSLDYWTKTESTSIGIETIKSTKSVDRGVVETLAKNLNDFSSPRWSRRGLHRYNNMKEECGFDEEYGSCVDASLSATAEQKTDLTALTSPIVPLTISFDGQTGEEFADPDVMDKLVASGLEMAVEDKNDWIEWKLHSSTKKLLEENNNNEMAILEQGKIMVYIGKSKRDGHGSNLPIIKTKSILPLSAEEMADLLMDSSKVKIYNKLSVGRTDVRTLGHKTKVVCNLTKPPMVKSTMVSCTLMHSRKLEQGQNSDSDSSYLVVSRATPGMVDDAMSNMSRNDILLGVNLLEDRGPNECIMTAVTHVYSPALPTILAKKIGVSSAKDFVRDIRNSCESVSS